MNFKSNFTIEEILFDLENDPDETKNWASDEAYREVLSGLRHRMIVRLQDSAYPNLEQSAEY